MKRLFLASSVKHVIGDIVKHIGNVKGMKLAYVYTPIEFNKDLSWTSESKNALTKEGFELAEYTITGKSRSKIKRDLEKFDVIYVSGGNQFYFLQKIQETSCAQVLRDLIEKQGKIYIGSSAGSMIAAPDISCSYRPDIEEELKSVGGLKLSDRKGLGLVDFMVFPHWGDLDNKETYFNYRLKHAYTTNDKIILLTNYQYVRVEDEMYKIEEVEK